MDNPKVSALEYLSRGWCPIPIPRVCHSCGHLHHGQICRSKDCACTIKYDRKYGKPTKGPSYPEWNKLRLHEEDIGQVIDETDGISLLVGEPSGGLVDVDLDSPEAIAVAPYLLPQTGLLSGRRKNPNSHWWYQLSDPKLAKTEKFAIRQKSGGKTTGSVMFLEIRGTGSCTTVFPSLHPDDDQYEWMSYGDPATVDRRSLSIAATKVAIAAVLARYWPGHGVRHEASLPIAGFFARANWPEDEAAEVIYVAAVAAGDTEAQDRRLAVRDTYRRVSNGQAATGRKTLLDYVPQEVVDQLSHWMSQVHAPPVQGKPQSQWELSVGTLSEIPEQPFSWLWYPYLPKGTLTLVEGDPGQGKTWALAALAAAVTRGEWPFFFQSDFPNDKEPGHVLYVSSEDDWRSTMQRRMRAVGTDFSKVHPVRHRVNPHTGQKELVTIGDIAVLEKAIVQWGVKLLIIDPIYAYLPRGIHMNAAEEIKPALELLDDMASRTRCAVILVRHLAKSTQGTRDISQGLGSIAISGTARVAFLVGEVKSEKNKNTKFAMVQFKNNLVPKGLTLLFDLPELDVFQWAGTSEMTSEQAFAPVERVKVAERLADFVRELVRKNTPPLMTIKDLKEEIKKANFDVRMFREAQLRIVHDLVKNEEGEWCLSLKE